MVQEAQAAEKRAKSEGPGGWDRDAVAVTLFKRSGEQVRWGCQYDSLAWPLLDLMREQFRPPVEEPLRAMPIHGKFPYRVCSLLGAYGPEHVIDASLAAIVRAELEWIVAQNTERDGDGFSRSDLSESMGDYLNELVEKGRPLGEFLSFFAVEAFLARQGDAE
jgi:hypothetical protein